MLVQKIAVRVQAWQLGAGTAKEREMIESGKILLRSNGDYELFSQEATGENGQIARRGDYFKVDAEGLPYPNEKAFFEKNHEHLENDWYLQKTRPVEAWTADEPENDIIRFLLDKKLLQIHPENPDRYFSAFLWGTLETAARDAVIVIHHAKKNDRGEIVTVDFNFVAKPAFDSTYTILQ